MFRQMIKTVEITEEITNTPLSKLDDLYYLTALEYLN